MCTVSNPNPYGDPPARLSTPEPSFGSGPSITELLDVGCHISDALDPNLPDEAFVGTGTGVGEAIDQLVVSVNQVPPTPSPVFEIARLGVYLLEGFKNVVATPYNIVCQQIKKEGSWYDLFPIDKQVANFENKWDGMTPLEKGGFVVVTGLSVAVIAAIALVLL